MAYRQAGEGVMTQARVKPGRQSKQAYKSKRAGRKSKLQNIRQRLKNRFQFSGER